jgi:hypothetical protein
LVVGKSDYLEFQLEKLQGGSVPFLWDRALREVLGNIMDENTDPEAKRRIKIEVVFKPSSDRASAQVAIHVGTKTVATQPIPATVVFGEVRGRLVAKDQHTSLWEEQPAQQPELVTTPKAGGEN